MLPDECQADDPSGREMTLSYHEDVERDRLLADCPKLNWVSIMITSDPISRLYTRLAKKLGGRVRLEIAMA